MSKLAQEFRAISAKKNTGVTAETSTGFSFNFLEEYDKDTSRETDSLIDTNSREIGDNVANQSAAGRSKKTKKKKKKNSTQDSGTPAIASTEEPTTIVDEKCVADMAHMNIKDSNIETSKQSTTHAEVEQEPTAISKNKKKSGSSKKKKKKQAEQAASVINAAPHETGERKLLSSRPPPGMEHVKPIHGPIVLSRKDPELSDAEKNMRRFGQGINVSAIGPRRKVVTQKDSNWANHLSNQAVADGAETATVATASSPFSFGFGLST